MPKSPTFLGDFCKGVKMFNFSSEIIIGRLFSGHTVGKGLIPGQDRARPASDRQRQIKQSVPRYKQKQ